MVGGKIKLVFDPETLKSHRWSEEAMLEHFSLAVLPSAPRFLKERDEIVKRARKYRSFPYEATKKATIRKARV
jgi:hypothetical protein